MADKLFQQGIQNAVQVCMNVQEGDRVAIITDQKARKIGQALADESIGTGAEARVYVLEDYGTRPMTSMPNEIMENLLAFQPNVTYWTAGGQEGELRMRGDMRRRIGEAYVEKDLPRPRHGHMININDEQIRQGMNADYQEVYRLTHQVLDLVKDAKKIKVTSVRGTDITAEFDPELKWVPCHGLYHEQGEWGNLPEGEVFTCPADLNGKLVVDVVGDHFSAKYGVLEHPLTIEVKDGLVTGASCQDQALEEEFLAYLDSAENGRRAGEFAIGTNTSVKDLVGIMLQDEKIPGIHVAFGYPYPDETGADWRSAVHVDVVPIGCTIVVDGVTIMENGEFRID